MQESGCVGVVACAVGSLCGRGMERGANRQQSWAAASGDHPCATVLAQQVNATSARPTDLQCAAKCILPASHTATRTPAAAAPSFSHSRHLSLPLPLSLQAQAPCKTKTISSTSTQTSGPAHTSSAASSPACRRKRRKTRPGHLKHKHQIKHIQMGPPSHLLPPPFLPAGAGAPHDPPRAPALPPPSQPAAAASPPLRCDVQQKGTSLEEGSTSERGSAETAAGILAGRRRLSSSAKHLHIR